VDKIEIVRTLTLMADLMELESENPFRPRSFRSGARALEALPEDLAEVVAEGRLEALRGVGKTLAAEIHELFTTGSSQRLFELFDAVPSGVREMLLVPGLGPKKIRVLWKDLGLESLDALGKACESSQVASLKGFGVKSQEKILDGIEYMRSVAGRYIIPEVEVVAEPLLEHLRSCPAVQRVEIAGSFRRRKEVLKDLDFVVGTSRPEDVAEHFCSFPDVVDVIARGNTKTSVRLESGISVDLRMVEDSEFAFALCHFTGSKEHNTAMRARAKERGLKLNEYGLFRGEEKIDCASEEEIHRSLDLGFIVPELRENLGEIEMAGGDGLPNLVEESDLRGVVHLHTTYSDGKASLEEMAAESRARGLSYMGVTDHSQTAFYAGGLKPDDVRRQHEEIDRLNEQLEDFRIFKGIESDILLDGSLDYDEDVLELFDFIVASLHSSLGQPADEITARVIRAIENPHTTMLGHATARLLLKRESAALDMDRVLAAAAEHGVVVEINANPRRLDMDWRLGPRARELGVLTSINPDAHRPAGIDDMRYGVGIARKAGFEKERVVNTLGVEEFAEFVGRRTG
jgi:DNA polymerase (family 10)